MGITSLIGIILGIVALNQIKRDPLVSGQGIAIAGIAVSGAFIFVVPIMASMLFPVFAKARVKTRQATCTSQVRQISTAVQMYCQDHNGRFPDNNWVVEIAPYLGNSELLFQCPEEVKTGNVLVSYGYSGALIMPNGKGEMEDDVLTPSQVGTVCDASPSPTYPYGGVISSNGMLAPMNRHHHGLVLGYCDGHARFVPEGYVDGDANNAVYSAIYAPAQFGFMKAMKKK
jgi:hypothetical protein